MSNNPDGLKRVRIPTPADLALADSADLLNEIFARMDIAVFMGIRGDIPIQHKGTFVLENRLSWRRVGHPNAIRHMIDNHLDTILNDRKPADDE